MGLRTGSLGWVSKESGAAPLKMCACEFPQIGLVPFPLLLTSVVKPTTLRYIRVHKDQHSRPLKWVEQTREPVGDNGQLSAPRSSSLTPHKQLQPFRRPLGKQMMQHMITGTVGAAAGAGAPK
ncbi:unnamed protein product [Heligmosomoides polygyrus]|uniref:Uncharacterized protein n=1 Tax=Heligmosomoides polygyrus TaxID=6339 RepID=A0A3P7XLH1_HELPZ|nr:unnamed protein product [Heligmosomoides polygyrus]